MIGRTGAAIVLVAFAQGLAIPYAAAQLVGARLGDRPIHIQADHGIEWQQAKHVYVARGNATITRDNATVTADVLYAYYRPVGQAAVSSAATKRQSPLLGGSSTEIYRLEADGHVHFINGDQQAYGDHAVYDLDQAIMILTGRDLRMTTPHEIITARDSIEWYDKKQIAVARGDATLIRGDRRLRANIITADVKKIDSQPAQITQINAYGNVLVSAPGQIAHGDEGAYDVATQTATLVGHVRLTKGNNELRGQYGVVDLKDNVSEILAAPPNSIATTADLQPRVEGMLVPNRKPGANDGQQVP